MMVDWGQGTLGDTFGQLTELGRAGAITVATNLSSPTHSAGSREGVWAATWGINVP